MIYRRKNTQKRNPKTKPAKNYNSDQQPVKQTKNPKKQRLIQVEAEIQELVHKPGSHSRDQIDKLMLERWQLRYQLNL